MTYLLKRFLRWLGFNYEDNRPACVDSSNPADFLESCDDFLEWVNDPTTSIADLESYVKGEYPKLNETLGFPQSPLKGQVYHCPTRDTTYIWIETASSSSWVPVLHPHRDLISPTVKLSSGSGGAGGHGVVTVYNYFR